MVIQAGENNCGFDYFSKQITPIFTRAPSFVTLSKVIVKCWEGILSSCLEIGETRRLHDTVAAKENYYTSCNKGTIVLVVTSISGVVKVGAAVML